MAWYTVARTDCGCIIDWRGPKRVWLESWWDVLECAWEIRKCFRQTGSDWQNSARVVTTESDRFPFLLN